MSYQEKKQFFDKILTIYGRKAVEEALLDNSLNIYKLHLAESNRQASILDHCIRLAKQRQIPVEWHDKKRLSFISKNTKQDQGIALDIHLDGLLNLEQLDPANYKHVILLDNVTNPQNLGMIIRSAAAGFIDALIIPQKGCAELGPLTIKASAGTLFKANIFRCKTTEDALQALKAHYKITELSLQAEESLYDYDCTQATAFVLGNETSGVSQAVNQASTYSVRIPMNRGVESLNVAVTAALISFHPKLIS